MTQNIIVIVRQQHITRTTKLYRVVNQL